MPCLFCVVDMHAITTDAAYGKPEELARATREVAAAYIAAGVDPARSPVFNQGQVPEHAELSWIFNCVARLGWMDRMTQFKEKSGKHKERCSVGPLHLSGADGRRHLVYKATHVPVGEDQKQHLELSRDIAQKFNNDFAAPDFFPLPEPVITGAATRVMSLRDGTKKMSKSEESDLSRINLTDDADAIANKIRRAKTDPLPLPESKDGLKDRPEAENLLNIYAALADRTRDAVIAEFAGPAIFRLQKILADLTVAKIGPVPGKCAACCPIRRRLTARSNPAPAGPRHRGAGHGRGQTPGRVHFLKTVLVTGAAKRLGRAIALDLAGAGWNVAIHYHGSADEAESDRAERRGPGRESRDLESRLSRGSRNHVADRPRRRRTGAADRPDQFRLDVRK